MNIHPGWWALVIGLNIWINVGIVLFFYYRRLERLEGYLEGIECIEWNRTICGDGYLGRQLRFSTVLLIVIMPSFLYKRGKTPKDSDKRIPKKLRMQIKAASIYMVLTGLAMVVFYFAGPDRAGA